MDLLRKAFSKLAERLDTSVDKLVYDFRTRHQLFSPLQILTYRSYGTSNRIHVRGRVLADKGISKADASHSVFDNILNMYRRLETDEVPGARLLLRFQDAEYHLTTDEEGHFMHDLEPSVALSDEALYHEATVELLHAPGLPVPEGLMAKAEIMVPPPDAEFGVISDIDDTIVKSSATNLLKMGQTAFFTNARTRMPFAGTTAFYKALILGRNGKRNNPFFYVSSSPWNLYDLLTDYLDVQQLPKGPLLLKHLGLNEGKLLDNDHLSHKMHQIDNILLTYPELKFVLIGDSGQEDARIYREVVKKYPKRILAIYIRDVECRSGRR